MSTEPDQGLEEGLALGHKGQICNGCPRHPSKRCGSSKIDAEVDVLFIAEQPDRASVDAGTPMAGHGGKILTTALKAVIGSDKRYKEMRYAFTYAVQCISETEDETAAPNKEVVHHCRPYLQGTIQRFNPKVIVAMGSTALRQLGVKQQYNDIRNKFTTHLGYNAPIYTTFSEKALLAAPGVFETFKLNLINIFDKVVNKGILALPLEEVSKDYLLPKTMDEALAACDVILNYSDGKTPAAHWPISVDTETTTLYPEKEGARIIAFCFGWDAGKSATILYDHPHAGEEYLARLPELTAKIREILASTKPKILHNAKFDLKFIELKYGMPVNAVAWDTLLGEHLLDEDKKGNYGLKVLTANFLPQYCGYEDKLYDLLNDEESASKVDEAEKELEDLREIIATEHPGYLKALEEYKEALVIYEADKQIFDVADRKYQFAYDDYLFCKSALAGKQAAWDVEVSDWPKGKRGKPKKPVKWFSKPEKPTAVKEPKKPEDPRSKKEQQISKDAGFENLPIHDLQVYGAVDGDVTRQLARLQRRRIAKEQSKVVPLMKSHAVPASRVLGRMEFGGTRVDIPYIDVLEEAFTNVIEKTEKELYEMTRDSAPPGKEINLNGAATLANVLYNWGWTHPNGKKMDAYEILAYTKKGQASTSEKILRQFVAYEDDKKQCPTETAYFIERLIKYRKASKARNTFLANIRALSKRDGFLHTQFHLNGTGTGRLSCVAADTLIETSVGTFRIEDLATQDLTNAYVKTHKNRMRRVLTVFPKGPERMYRVVLANGSTLDCTMKHRFLTPQGWKKLQDLKVGAFLDTETTDRSHAIEGSYGRNTIQSRCLKERRPKSYVILPHDGVSQEVSKRVERSFATSLCGIKIRKPLRLQGSTESSNTARSATRCTTATFNDTCNSPEVFVQRILSSSQYRASQVSACGSNGTSPLHAARLQSLSVTTNGDISRGFNRSRGECGKGSRAFLRTTAHRQLALDRDALVCEESRAPKQLLYGKQQGVVLEQQPLRSVSDDRPQGRRYSVSSTVPFTEGSGYLLGRLSASREVICRDRRETPYLERRRYPTRQGEGSANSITGNSVAPVQRNRSMAQYCESYASNQDGTSAFGRSQIQSIEYLGIQEVWDLSVEEDESYVAHGFVNHNSSDMNMQNLPKFLAGWNLKKLFLPDDDSMVFVNMDYKGAEVRVFCAYARDPALIQALNDGMDMHSFFAAKVFKRPYEMYARRDDAVFIPDGALRKLLDQERSNIKRVVFGILYGAGPEKISETIGVSVDEAKVLIALLYQMFPEIALYATNVELEVARDHFVETFFGRRRRFPLAGISRHAGRAKRQGRNFKIQSTSSDIVIGQLIEMEEPLRCDLGGRMLLTVHDSIAFQLPKRHIGQLHDFVEHYAKKRVADKYAWMAVPFEADTEIGENYGECQSIAKYLAKYPLLIQPEGVIEENELLTELRNDAFEAA